MNQTVKTCLIVTSRVDGAEQLTIDLSAYDAVICADRGLQVAEALDLLGDVPVYLIGDYDSGSPPTEAERAAASGLVVLPTVKDMTDSEAAIDLAVSKGFERIHVLGGLGGRFDHSMGNLGMLAKYVEDPRVTELWFEDGQNRVFMKTPGTFRVPARGPENRFDYFGLIAYSSAVEGLTITGA
ncbi:MAG: thiamine diphosphokinase, partial [Clostridia bacterium]|nr:thiamine diphosphokinase [Clostridia bacterium]